MSETEQVEQLRQALLKVLRDLGVKDHRIKPMSEADLELDLLLHKREVKKPTASELLELCGEIDVTCYGEAMKLYTEKSAVLEAWHSIFGTSQLSHAIARLNAAEEQRDRLRFFLRSIASEGFGWDVGEPLDSNLFHQILEKIKTDGQAFGLAMQELVELRAKPVKDL